MIYIVSGASRSGKTIVAKKMLKEMQVPYMSTDCVMMGFMHGVEKVNLHDKMWPDEIAVKIWGFLKHFILTLMHSEEDYLIEGEAFLPNLVKELMDAYPENLRVVFIGYSSANLTEKVKDVKKYASDHDWLNKESNVFIEEHIKNMIAYAKNIKKECQKVGVTYLDVSKNFEASIEEVLSYLKND
jgi:hypothetical protein